MPLLNAEQPPVRLAPLVGRQRQRRDMLQTLAPGKAADAHRADGTGKTRLALATADAAAGGYGDGVSRIALAKLRRHCCARRRCHGRRR